MNKIFLKTILFFSLLTIFAACDKENTSVGSDLIGNEHYEMKTAEFEVTNTDEFTGPVQTNNLDINQFGIYDNPKFGKTTANFVTQVELASVNPTFINTATGLNQITVESVVLYIPYTATLTETNTNGNKYILEDLYGTSADLLKEMKLSIFENKFFMSGINIGTGEPMPYYSNQKSDIASLTTGNARLNEEGTTIPQAENDSFKFSADPHSDGATTPTYSPPGMKINLNKAFFKSKIILAGSSNLINNSEFKNYFRGLYFKIEEKTPGNGGAMALMNFKKGTITIKYKDATSSTDSAIIDKSIVLNLTGNTINLLDNDFSTSGTVYNSSPTANRIYLRGGDGKYTTLKPLIHADTLQKMKKEKWQINDANLVFYIDDAELGTAVKEPARLFLYDKTNKRPLIDYYFDGTTSTYANWGKYIFGGNIDVDPADYYSTTNTKRGKSYKVRLTNYMRNVVSKDSTQVELGLAVCRDYRTIGMAKRRNSTTTLPYSAVMEPLGTVLYNSATANGTKRLKLEIVYTKPD